MNKKFSIKNNRLAKTIIISGSVLIVVAFVILRYDGFLKMLSGIFGIIRPVIIGGVIAFALNRPLNYFHYKYRILFAKIKNARYKKNPKKRIHLDSGKAPFIIACITTYLITLAVLVGIFCFIIPQIYESIVLFSDNITEYSENFKAFIETFKTKHGNLFGIDLNVSQILDESIPRLKAEISQLAEYIPTVLSTAFNITSGIIGFVIDMVIGIVFSLYILLDKRNLKKNSRLIAKMIIKGEKYNKFEKVIQIAYKSFSNFISGQFLEAVILGILCFIGMTIFGFEYAPLISVIIGITNMIPIAGPIRGTIPGALILLLVNPIDAVWFVIFVIIIQQIDSNIIYPKVVGNSVGLPSLWVLLAITIGGGLGGVMGMILGVPIMSVIYTLISEKLEDVKSKNESDAEDGEDKKEITQNN